MNPRIKSKAFGITVKGGQCLLCKTLDDIAVGKETIYLSQHSLPEACRGLAKGLGSGSTVLAGMRKPQYCSVKCDGTAPVRRRSRSKVINVILGYIGSSKSAYTRER